MMPPHFGKDLALLQQRLGYTFRDVGLLEKALQHSSAGGQAFERFEFLGDRLLGLAVADLLYRTYPWECEGDLAKRHAHLVSRPTLCAVSHNIGLEGYVTSEASSVLADTLESVIASIYLDQGWEVVKDWVQNHFQEVMQTFEVPPVDAKTALQEWLQADKHPAPTYEVIEVKGPAHNPLFSIQVVLPEGVTFQAQGSSKQIAQQKAAAAALEYLQKKHR